MPDETPNADLNGSHLNDPETVFAQIDAIAGIVSAENSLSQEFRRAAENLKATLFDAVYNHHNITLDRTLRALTEPSMRRALKAFNIDILNATNEAGKTIVVELAERGRMQDALTILCMDDFFQDSGIKPEIHLESARTAGAEGIHQQLLDELADRALKALVNGGEMGHPDRPRDNFNRDGTPIHSERGFVEQMQTPFDVMESEQTDPGYVEKLSKAALEFKWF